MRDPNYKMRFRPTPIRRLSKYDHLPPPLTLDPPARKWRDWDERCRAVYDYMIALKRGVVPHDQRRGLWFHETGSH